MIIKTSQPLEMVHRMADSSATVSFPGKQGSVEFYKPDRANPEEWSQCSGEGALLSRGSAQPAVFIRIDELSWTVPIGRGVPFGGATGRALMRSEANCIRKPDSFVINDDFGNQSTLRGESQFLDQVALAFAKHGVKVTVEHV